jgi:putative addiction module component (TIGR02574 family)
LTQQAEAAKIVVEVLMIAISEIEKSMLALSVDERVRLALALLLSLESDEPDTSEDWESVISARAAAYRNGESKTEAAELVLARLRERVSG